MSPDSASVAMTGTRPRRRLHFHHHHSHPHHRPEGSPVHAHADTLDFLARSVPYTPHLPRQDSSADSSPSPSISSGSSDSPSDNDSSSDNTSSAPTVVPAVVPSSPSPSEDVKLDGQPSEQPASPQTERQAQESSADPAPAPSQNQNQNAVASSSEDTGPRPSPTPTWTPEPEPQPTSEQPSTSDPIPASSDPAPQWTPSSAYQPPPETYGSGPNAPVSQSETVWEPEPTPSSTQGWASAPVQDTLAQSWTDWSAAAESIVPSDAVSSEAVVAGIIGLVSSSSSLSSAARIASASTASVARISSPSAASGRTLTPNVQPTNPGVTASQPPPYGVSASDNVSGSAEAASAGSGSEILSTGAKAGISIGAIAAVGAAVFLILFCLRRRKRSNTIVASTDRSNPYAFSAYGAAEEKGASNLRRNGTQHSALDFSDGPLPPQQRSRWRHLSTLAVPFAAKDRRSRGSSGPGMAGVGSTPSRFDSNHPSFDRSRGAYPYARSESDDDHHEVIQAVDDDASNFRNTHYEEWLTYDRAGVVGQPASAGVPVKPSSSGPGPKLRQPQARRVPVPSLDPDPFADHTAQADTQASATGIQSRPMPSRARTLDNMYGIYTEDEPVVQHLPYRVTPPPVQAQQFVQPQSALVGHAV
ncbi:hypothetical protein CC85DRAFT_303638 [Cutaneotrichosporon oleaginosum]|uniref:Uncharacterized protein n=1 Tax=Cutaneotrichosporon oleaginosum TaxID=879819 RepID=A0A0J0XIP1_9TREE|nr:uncharacterized protein CC85DRAFT_303638 [Cutaneotrichosporon oleaginosum]KLT40960.1 hypothetical protein CC85DRAFT_303638 [Cutaneotrichosporon oleaginosum]TXT06230.1 hypothetical protein COLE_05561 [Cutaneotrichosporon oleaginosum]